MFQMNKYYLTSKKTINLLLIEDDIDQVEIIKSAFDIIKENENLYVVYDGQEALDFLYNRNKYSDKNKAPRPDLIFLDIRIPKIHGLEVLRIIKNDPDLKKIPVIILSGSDRDVDIAKSYELGANSYICKPRHGGFLRLLSDLREYWINICTLPPDD